MGVFNKRSFFVKKKRAIIIAIALIMGGFLFYGGYMSKDKSLRRLDDLDLIK